MALIHYSEFFIGLGSGVSWLAWALKKNVVMICNFSEDGHEFTFDTIRVTNKSVCHGCWNNKNFKFDRGDYNWCPVLKGYPNQFECQTSITEEMVLEQMEPYLVQ
jgi:autotransporter strand-loop-strand O-heptosyltransferase